MEDQHNDEEDFNPIGTVYILVGYMVLIALFWGYAYLEMLRGS